MKILPVNRLVCAASAARPVVVALVVCLALAPAAVPASAGAEVSFDIYFTHRSGEPMFLAHGQPFTTLTECYQNGAQTLAALARTAPIELVFMGRCGGGDLLTFPQMAKRFFQLLNERKI